MACFMARRKEMRFSSCSAMLSATSWGVGIGVLDLHDVQRHLAAGHLLQRLLQGLYARAALADNHAGPGGVDADVQLGACALDVDAGDAGVRAAGVAGGLLGGLLDHLGDGLANVVIFNQVVGKILFPSVPLGAPVQDDTDAGAVGINFLSHFISSLTSGRARS